MNHRRKFPHESQDARRHDQEMDVHPHEKPSRVKNRAHSMHTKEPNPHKKR